MKQKSNILHIQFKAADVISPISGEHQKLLIFNDVTSQTKFNDFVNSLAHDQHVDVFYDANKDDGTLAQLAKIHACIRQMAIDTGDDFEDLKLEIKRQSGLCVAKEINGEKFMICKSFSKCSKEELGLAIEKIIKLGDFVGINFR